MKRLIPVLILAAAPLTGCVIHTYEGGGGGGSEVIIETGHIHTEYCGHYYYHGGWYIMANHRHYDGCGHVYRYNMWIHDDGGPVHGNTVVVVAGHVHNDYCGHFYANGGWYMSNGHHHGPGCGHVYQGGNWCFVEAPHRPPTAPPHSTPDHEYRKPELHDQPGAPAANAPRPDRSNDVEAKKPVRQEPPGQEKKYNTPPAAGERNGNNNGVGNGAGNAPQNPNRSEPPGQARKNDAPSQNGAKKESPAPAPAKNSEKKNDNKKEEKNNDKGK